MLIEAVDLPTPEAGDIVAVPTTGALHLQHGQHLQRHARSPVIFAGEGESRVVVRRETIEELGARDVD